MPERILMIRLSAIGDVINVLPSVALLRRARPAAFLAFAVEDRAADLIRGHPLLDQAIVFPRRRWRALLRSPDPRRWSELWREVGAFRRELRGARFDVALDFQGNLKGAAHALASGAPRRIGFARGHDREGSHLFATEVVIPPADRPHRVDKFASLLGPLGADSGERTYVLPGSPEAAARVERLLGDLERDGGRLRAGFVALHPGTSEHGAAKRWPPERFAELARRLRDERGLAGLVTWGPGEEELARRVCARAPGAALLAPPTASLLELAELVRRAAAFVSADTGPMHLAAAMGTRCVALFGPKDPAVYRPYGAGHRVVRGGDGSRPAAMDAIGVDRVLAALTAVLDASPPADSSSAADAR